MGFWGHSLGEASSLESLGLVELKRGTPLAAQEYFREARTTFSGLGEERGVFIMERRLGEAFRDSGDFDQVETHLRSAVSWFRDSGDSYQVIRTLRSLALDHQEQRRPEAAREVLEEARGIAESIQADTDVKEITRLLATSESR